MLFYTLISIVWISAIVLLIWVDLADAFGTAFFGTIITFLLTGITSASVFHRWPDTYVLEKTVRSPIISLTNNTNLTGQFFLGCGVLDSSEKYIFMRDLGNNSYLRDSIDTSGTIIKESKTEAPALAYDVILRHNDRRWRYIAPVWMRDEGEERNVRYRLIVPMHTIIQRFEVK